ncbi:MAG: flagellar protein FliT [Gammaproteobacteria bacterium]|jgi:hypothetical protein|nr:flagellar protein FliT [Gammaproteobacteria bacterium]
MNKEREQHWLTILRISGNMRQLAQTLQWADLAHLEHKRQNLIKSFFSSPVAPEDAELVREGIYRILDMDQQIIFMGKRHRGEISNKLADFNTPKKNRVGV